MIWQIFISCIYLGFVQNTCCYVTKAVAREIASTVAKPCRMSINDQQYSIQELRALEAQQVENSSPLSQRWYRLKQLGMTKNQKEYYAKLWPIYGINYSFNTFINSDILMNDLKYENLQLDGSVFVDIGFGTGDSLLHLAKQFPRTLCIGCDIHRSGISHTMKKLHEENISNAKIIRGDATKIFGKHFDSNSVDSIFVYFPDPWLDIRRDLARRMIRPTMLDNFHRILRQNGSVRLTTDVEEYARFAVDLFARHEVKWQHVSSNKFSQISEANTQYRPITKYGKKALEEGRPIIDLHFRLV